MRSDIPPPDEFPDHEQRVVQLLRQAAATERAPASLRADVDALRAGAARRHRGPTDGFRARRPGWATPGGRLRIATVSVLPLAAALAVALVLVLGGGSHGPLINQTAELATRGAVTAAPGVDPTAPRLLTARVENLHFPDWQSQGGWRSTGTRVDQVGSRSVTTVYYQSAGRQIAYSIVARPALHGSSPPAGRPYRTFRQAGRTYIVWTAVGHTCVLSSAKVGAEQLWSLARGETV